MERLIIAALFLAGALLLRAVNPWLLVGVVAIMVTIFLIATIIIICGDVQEKIGSDSTID